ncbi:MAG: cellulase family glycosylhydrolase [Fibrobacter sp.]|nr:cellulase family glycosylhydrolase [Fibrobacter sp.]
MKKLLPCLMALAAIPAFADATTAVAKKVGPVSHYGTLGSANGKVIGTKTNQPAILRGMSWFWSDATGLPYYSKTVLDWATDNLKIDVIRFAMGINYYGTDTKNKLSDGYSYMSAPDSYKVIVDKMIEAAIENDIYIILDWHSHQANSETAAAKAFFSEMAQKYGKIPNVIFEIFNEPTGSWGEVANYANQVIPGIRAASENLIIVGNPGWSSQPNAASGLTQTNLAYSLHFYAASHPVSGYGSNATQAMNSGKAVFATEYGTVNYDGAGTPNASATQSWFDFMDQNMISSCNWSLRQVQTTENGNVKNETSAFFDGSTELTSKALLDAAKTSTSGAIVKQYLVGKGRTWADSLVKGKNTGACAFKSFSAGELDGTVASKLAGGCTYTSSNENVVSNSGEIKGAGFAIMTGNDGSQSVITIKGIPAQTVPNFQDLTCNFGGTCSTNRTLSYSGGPNKEWIVTIDPTTLEGSKFTLTSLDPSIVTVKTATCSNTSCSNAQKGKQVLMYEFKSFGSAKIVATAAATPGYKAVQDTITVTYEKGSNKMTNNFKNTTLALGGVAEKLVPDTTMYHTPVTYTFNGEPTSKYVTKNGNALQAGTENAVVKITANAPETETYKEFHMTITVVVGDSTQAVNKSEVEAASIVKTNPKLPLSAIVAGNQLHVNSNEAGDINVEVFSITGQSIMSKTLTSNGTASMSLASIPNGSYLVVISQGVRQLNVKWNKISK